MEQRRRAQREQGLISGSREGRGLGRGDEGLDLIAFQGVDDLVVDALGLDGPDAFGLFGERGVLEGEETKEGFDGRKALVASAGGVAAVAPCRGPTRWR